MPNEDIINAALNESRFLAKALTTDPRMADEAFFVRKIAEQHAGGAPVDMKALDRCLRRMRIAAADGKYPARWPDDLAP